MPRYKCSKCEKYIIRCRLATAHSYNPENIYATRHKLKLCRKCMRLLKWYAVDAFKEGLLKKYGYYERIH